MNPVSGLCNALVNLASFPPNWQAIGGKLGGQQVLARLAITCTKPTCRQLAWGAPPRPEPNALQSPVSVLLGKHPPL
jgi:endonuclease/exonuclease/phosphatase (EEP) superfamily protein YafD